VHEVHSGLLPVSATGDIANTADTEHPSMDRSGDHMPVPEDRGC